MLPASGQDAGRIRSTVFVPSAGIAQFVPRTRTPFLFHMFLREILAAFTIVLILSVLVRIAKKK
jgi:hypothetical protein